MSPADPEADVSYDPEHDVDDNDDENEDVVVTPSSPYAPEITLVIDEPESGQRLDRVLAERSEVGRSRNVLQRWIAEGRVFVDGVPATRKTTAEPLARVRIVPAPPPPSHALPEAIPLVVLHEDEHLIVVDKPPGMVVHPAPGHPSGTLVNALLHHADVSGVGDVTRPGIVHRLDKDTSGVMVAAKTPEAHAGLVELFQAHDIEREYLAIAIGPHLGDRTFDTFHGRHPHDRKRFSSTVSRGKRAVTHLRVREPVHGGALVSLRLETGRTHQIRVHLADQHTPVLADPVYGRPSRDPCVRDAAARVGRQALHAAVLGFVHPITRAPMRFEAALPSDMQAALDVLRAR